MRPMTRTAPSPATGDRDPHLDWPPLTPEREPEREREQVAREIEALILDPTDHCIEEYNAGVTNAARIARGPVTTHDPLCLYIGDGPCRLCFRLETARAEARAEELGRHANNCRGMWDEWLHDLREQVARMRHRKVADDPSTDLVRRSDVLALLGGGSDD